MDLLRRLLGAEAVKKGGEARVAMVGMALLTEAAEAVVEGEVHRGAGAGVFVVVEVDRIRLAHEFAEDGLEVGGPADLGDAREGRGLVLRDLVALPDGEGFGGLADEEDLAFCRIGVRGKEKEDGLFLIDPAEIEQVGALDEGLDPVRAAPGKVGGMDHGEGAWRQGRGEADPVFSKELQRNFLVLHRANCSDRSRDCVMVSPPSPGRGVREGPSSEVPILYGRS